MTGASSVGIAGLFMAVLALALGVAAGLALGVGAAAGFFMAGLGVGATVGRLMMSGSFLFFGGGYGFFIDIFDFVDIVSPRRCHVLSQDSCWTQCLNWFWAQCFTNKRKVI